METDQRLPRRGPALVHSAGGKDDLRYRCVLVSLADPTNEFSFLSYLHQRGRIYHFLNAQFDAMPRQEYRNYLEWASRTNKNVVLGEEVLSVEFDGAFLVHTTARTLTADTNDFYMPSYADYFLQLERQARETFNTDQILTSDGIGLAVLRKTARRQRGLAEMNLSLIAWRSQRIVDRIRGVVGPVQRPSFVEWPADHAARGE